MKPRVLFLTSDYEDFLADGILHGLREILGAEVVDFPKQEILYQTAPQNLLAKLHGRGFTMYGLQEDIPIERFHITQQVIERKFDLVIVGDVYRSWGLLHQLWPYLHAGNTAVLDGADSPAIYPHAGKWWREPTWRWLPAVHTRFGYYKREWTEETFWIRSFRLLPKPACRILSRRMRLRPISFSIPAEKVITTPVQKRKLLGAHVVDPEVAVKMNGRTGPVFDTEEAYFRDLQESKFAVTTKRSGWDCLRHYEIAANGCVPCFRGLDYKPATCAPHGLDDTNCVIYRDADSLLARLSAMTDLEYARLQENALAWVRNNTTRAAAGRLLNSMGHPVA